MAKTHSTKLADPVITCVSMLTAGLAFGAATSLLNSAGGPFLAQFLGMGWSWVAFGAAVGWAAPTTRSAMLLAASALLAAVVAYYAADVAFGVYETRDRTAAALQTTTDWSAASRDALVWSIRALLIGPALGAIGRAIHRRDAVGLLAELMLPIAILANVTVVVLPLGRPQPQLEVIAHAIIATLGVLWAAWAVVRRY